jgi:hypothetical protein
VITDNIIRFDNNITLRWFYEVLSHEGLACLMEKGIWLMLSFAYCDQTWSCPK